MSPFFSYQEEFSAGRDDAPAFTSPYRSNVVNPTLHVYIQSNVVDESRYREVENVSQLVKPPLLLFVGCSTLDSIASVGEFPSADSRTIASEFITAGGGPAATAAVTAARLGAHTAFAGVIGHDEEGDRILAGLETEGVDTSCVVRSRSHLSGASLIIVSDDGDSRAIVTRPVPPLNFPSDGVLRATAKSAAWVHVDHLGWSAVQLLGSGIRLSVDAGNPIPGFDPDGVELFVPTIDQLRAQFGTDLSETQLVQTAIDRGARAVVATDGANGAWAHSGSGSVVHVPSVPTRIISTLGAGDVFHGALLAAVAAGQGLVDAVKLANQIAAESCTGLDGRSRIPHQRLTFNFSLPAQSTPNKGKVDHVFR